jgi:hypothetical protein
LYEFIVQSVSRLYVVRGLRFAQIVQEVRAGATHTGLMKRRGNGGGGGDGGGGGTAGGEGNGSGQGDGKLLWDDDAKSFVVKR